MTFDSVILAGGRPDPILRKEHGIDFVWQAEHKGKSMLDIVRTALSGVHEALVVGGPAGLSRRIEGGETFLQSFEKGLRAAEEEWVMMASADLPFLTKAGVDQFLSLCDKSAAVNYSICRVQLATEKYPGLKRTSLRLREGEFTGGNVFLLHRQTVLQALPKIQSLYDSRKNVLKLAGAIGPGVLLTMIGTKIAPTMVRLKHFETAIAKVLGASVRAVECLDPSLVTDIDNSVQIAWLKALQNG